MPNVSLKHSRVAVDGIPLHIVEAGARNTPAVLLLHGWPESWIAFEQVLSLLGERTRAIAIDLPGIGESRAPARANDKRTLARYIRSLTHQLDLQSVTLVGHDVGGQIVYACLRDFAGELSRAVMMNIAIPGVDPWSEVTQNPRIWHFAFHAIPELPERLVANRAGPYFDYFFDTLSARPGAVSARARARYVQAYSRPEALRTGFDWYRAFPQDERDNKSVRQIHTPVLYLRGEKEQGDIERYVQGLRSAGLRNVTGHLIRHSGHFAPEEQPREVASAILNFMTSGRSAGTVPRRRVVHLVR
jgi:pimeloyl-ACP methyl ester carboxylesterase